MKKPRKPTTRTVACRLRHEEIDRLNAIADDREWSFAKVMRKAVEQFLASVPWPPRTQRPGVGSRPKTRVAMKRGRKRKHA